MGETEQESGENAAVSRGTLPDGFDNPYRSPRAPPEAVTQPAPTRPTGTAPGDARALRAWRAAVIGLFLLPPLLNLYSVWLLLELAIRDDPLSAKGNRHFLLAWLVNAAACLEVGFLLAWAIPPGWS